MVCCSWFVNVVVAWFELLLVVRYVMCCQCLLFGI